MSLPALMNRRKYSAMMSAKLNESRKVSTPSNPSAPAIHETALFNRSRISPVKALMNPTAPTSRAFPMSPVSLKILRPSNIELIAEIATPIGPASFPKTSPNLRKNLNMEPSLPKNALTFPNIPEILLRIDPSFVKKANRGCRGLKKFLTL